MGGGAAVDPRGSPNMNAKRPGQCRPSIERGGGRCLLWMCGTFWHCESRAAPVLPRQLLADRDREQQQGRGKARATRMLRACPIRQKRSPQRRGARPRCVGRHGPPDGRANLARAAGSWPLFTRNGRNCRNSRRCPSCRYSPFALLSRGTAARGRSPRRQEVAGWKPGAPIEDVPADARVPPPEMRFGSSRAGVVLWLLTTPLTTRV